MAAKIDTDFDTKAAALVRRRKMAELLQADALKPIAGAGNVGRTSFLEPLGQLAKAWAGTHMNKGLDTEEAENEAARSAAFDAVMARMPQGTPEVPAVPATPDQPGAPAVPGETRPPSPMLGEQQTLDAMFNQAAPTPSLSELGPQPMPKLAPAIPEGPMIPGKPAVAAIPAKSPTMAELLPWAADAARTGQTGKDLAKQVYSNVIPKALTPEQIEDMKLKREQIAATQAATQQAREDSLELKRQDLKRLEAKDNQTAQDKADQRALTLQIAEMSAASARYSADSRASGKSDDFKITTSIDSNGRALREKGGIHYQMKSDGTIDTKPYTGAVIPQTVHEKNVAAVAKGDEAIGDMQAIYNAVGDDKDIYGLRARIGSHAPKILGAQGAAMGLNEAQGAIRTQAAAMTAVYTHSLYGASFSGTEQAKAKGFVINDDDPTSEVKRKLKGRMDLEREHMLKKGGAANAAYTGRQGGAPPADAPPAASNPHGIRVVGGT